MLPLLLLAPVVLVHPQVRSVSVPADTNLVFRFDHPVDRDAFRDGLSVFGRWSGAMAGSVSFFEGDQRVSFTPARRFSAGELVTVYVAYPVHFDAQFWIASGSGPMRFRETQSLSTRRGGEATSRAYGGIASDVNDDGWLDLTIVNEDTADLRVFLNRAERGSFETTPRVFPVGRRASPSEPADFDRDGRDWVTSSFSGSWLLFENQGDGSFALREIFASPAAASCALLFDADNDSDLDMALIDEIADRVIVMINGVP